MEAAQLRTVRRTSFLLIGLCLIVILWGAFVRFSHSGDGCGESWPLCNGALVPTAEGIAPWIEYTHRLTSGLFGLLVVFLVVYVFRCTRPQNPLRRCVVGVGVFTVTEALVGAGLVLLGLVGDNPSLERALWLSLHVVNTLILLGFLTVTYLQSRSFPQKLPILPPLQKLPYVLLFLLLAIAGSIASLSNTLYPSSSLLAGIASDFNPSSPLILRLRILHPLFGFLFFLLIIEWWQRTIVRAPELLQRLLLLTGINFLIGALTLVLLSPIAGRLSHILVTDLVWMQLYGLSILSVVENDSIGHQSNVAGVAYSQST